MNLLRSQLTTLVSGILALLPLTVTVAREIRIRIACRLGAGGHSAVTRPPGTAARAGAPHPA